MMRILIAVTLLMTLLSGCGDKSKVKMPEDVAKEFLEAIYVTGDLKTARQLSVKELSDLLYHYRSMSTIQRHVLGLRLTTADITVRDVEADFFRRSEKDVKVELHIRGDFEGDRRADDRFLLMTKDGRRWKVKRITKR